MGKGKIAAMCSHASLTSFLLADDISKNIWIREGMKKVILKVKSEKELLEFKRIAKREKLPNELITDRGLTQIKPGTITALGIGPANDNKIDKITKNLKLL